MWSESHFNASYVGKRKDIQDLIPVDARIILDLGCSTGILGEAIKQQEPSISVYGVEFDSAMAQVAAKKLDGVFCADIETFDWKQFGDLRFDCIIFADILEHLRDPWSVLSRTVEYISPNCRIIVSLPNIRHISSLYWIYVRGVWPMRDRGIHDRTHLRFFTLKNISELLDSAGYEVEAISRNYRIIEHPHWFNAIFTKMHIAFIVDMLPGFRDFLTYQYLVTGKEKVVGR